MNKHKLLEKMEMAGVTRKELAQLLYVSVGTFNKKLNKESPFNLDEVNTICQRLNIKSTSDFRDIFLPMLSDK